MNLISNRVSCRGLFLSEKIKKVIFVLIMATAFFAPKIYGRDYVGIVFLYLIFLFVIINESISINESIIAILGYTFIIVTLDLLILFKFSSSFMSILRIFFYAFIPPTAFLLGNSINKSLEEVYFEKVIWFIGLLQGLIGILQQYSYKLRIITLSNYSNIQKYNRFFEEWQIGRIVGTIGNPNTYGVFMTVFVLFIVNILIPKYKKNFKVFMLIILTFIISIYSIILSQSRTAYLLLVLGLILSNLLNKKNLLLKLLLLFIGVIGAYFIILKVPFVFRRFSLESIFNMGHRTEIWQGFINTYLYPINIHTIFGYGTNFLSNIDKSVDNYYLQIIMQYGLFGLIVYITMILKIMFSYKRIKEININNFIVISYSIILISDFTGTINMHQDIVTFLFFILGYYHHILEENIKHVNFMENYSSRRELL